MTVINRGSLCHRKALTSVWLNIVRVFVQVKKLSIGPTRYLHRSAVAIENCLTEQRTSVIVYSIYFPSFLLIFCGLMKCQPSMQFLPVFCLSCFHRVQSTIWPCCAEIAVKPQSVYHFQQVFLASTRSLWDIAGWVLLWKGRMQGCILLFARCPVHFPWPILSTYCKHSESFTLYWNH